MECIIDSISNKINPKSGLQRIYGGGLNLGITQNFMEKTMYKMFCCTNLTEIALSTNNFGNAGAITIAKIINCALNVMLHT